MGIAVTYAITYMFTREWEISIEISLIANGIKMVLYYIHERIYKGVK